MLILKKCLTVLAVTLLVLFLILVIINAAFEVIYSGFYRSSERAFRIPGLNSGFVPQGFEDTEYGMLIAGYMNDGTPSRIYVTDGEKKEELVELYNKDGTPHTSHAGGVCRRGERVYLAGDGMLEIFLLSDVTDADGRATVIDTFDPGFDPAWCTVRGEYILLGSFANSDSDDYPPNQKECFTTPSGEKNVSIIKIFKFNDRADKGINPSPVAVISTGEKVQGLAFIDDENLVLSTSYGLSSSRLIFHKLNLDYKTERGYNVGAAYVPLYYLDSTTETKTVKAPPMSEEMIVKDGYLYVMNESACNKYIFGKFLGQYHAYKYKI